MDFSKYDGALGARLTFLQTERFRDPAAVLSAAKVLAQEPAVQADPSLLGYLLYVMGDAHFSLGDSVESLGCLTRAQRQLAHTESWDLRADCLNLLGLLFLYQGNYTASTDCFFAGQELTDAHRLTEIGCKLRMNLALVCQQLGDVRGALDSCLTVLELLSDAEPFPAMAYDRMCVHVAALSLYLQLNDLESAAQSIREAETLIRDAALEPTPSYWVYRTIYADRIGQEEAGAEYLDRALGALHGCSFVADYFDDCIALLHLLEARGDDARIDEILSLMESSVSGRSFTAQWLLLLECRVRRYRQQGLTEPYHQALEAYFDACQQNADTLNSSRRAMLVLKRANIQVRQQNRELTVFAQTDDLTGLPNRRRLNEVQEIWFDRAQRRRERIGVAMLDVDRFKQLNDAGGHGDGDACLRALGRILRRQMNSEVFCARYGGDEFVLLFRGKTDAEILLAAGELRREAAAVSFGSAHITLSIGVRNAVPLSENRVWDFTSLADKALYHVKKHGRDGVLLVHGPHDFPE